MNTEQERAFEQILHSVQQAQIPGNDWRRELKLIESTCRAALQSQDREDALIETMLEACDEWSQYVEVDTAPRTLREHIQLVIDHARRIEGDGE